MNTITSTGILLMDNEDLAFLKLKLGIVLHEECLDIPWNPKLSIYLQCRGHLLYTFAEQDILRIYSHDTSTFEQLIKDLVDYDNTSG